MKFGLNLAVFGLLLGFSVLPSQASPRSVRAALNAQSDEMQGGKMIDDKMSSNKGKHKKPKKNDKMKNKNENSKM
jgi:hypothetical protein